MSRSGGGAALVGRAVVGGVLAAAGWALATSAAGSVGMPPLPFASVPLVLAGAVVGFLAALRPGRVAARVGHAAAALPGAAAGLALAGARGEDLVAATCVVGVAAVAALGVATARGIGTERPARRRDVPAPPMLPDEPPAPPA